MPIRLLALDLDGTILVDLHTIPPRTQAAIRAAVAQGVQVTIATGRVYEVTRKFVELLGLTTPTICCQGALIYNGQTGQVINQVSVPPLLAEKMIDLARSYQLALNLYVAGCFYTEALTSLTQEILVASGATVVQVRDLKQVRQTPPLKGLVVHPANEIEAVIKDLKAALGDSLSVVRSSKVLIELFSPTVSKGQALATLAQYLEIPQQEVMAIGDQDNDIEMIAWAGLGVAMGNASAGAKAVAQVVAPPITEEGAAWAIEEYIFDQVTW